ncbi:MAG TPA: ABC transporter substrate-binding protein [Candidatus Dormibacteraeota bacterium]
MRRLRAAGLALCAGASLAALAALLPGPVFADTSSSGVPADRQDYVSNTMSDPYQAYESAFSGQNPSPDAVDIHVGANPQQATFTSYLHLELEALPDGANVSSLKLTLHPTDDQVRQQENVNSGTPNTNCVQGTPTCNAQPNDAIIDAFPLKVPYPAKFPDSDSPSAAPAVDTTGPEVVASFNSRDASWTFELAPMIPYWKKHGNTGLAVVPDAAGTLVSWQVGFQRSSTEGTATYTLSGQSSLLQSTVFQPTTTTTTGAGVGTSLPGLSLAPKAPSQGVNAPPQVVQPVAPRRIVIASTPPKGWVPIWALVLVGSFAAAIALLANPVSAGLATAGGALGGLTGQLRLHPRMFAIAGVLLVWSSTVAVYGNTIGKQVFSPTVVSENEAPGTTTSTANNPSGNAPGTTASGAAGSGSVSGAAAASAAQAQQYANSPNPPSANLFTSDQEGVGMTDKTIQLCAHAALTFGPAFNIGASDLNVFWQMVNAQGGVWGRKLVQPGGADGISVQDDGYQPSKAVAAAQACADQSGGDFFLLGGIGFDQIPAVRVWAEQHHMLYVHHIALESGSDGLRYSFTMLPPLETVGQQFAQYYVANYAGQKLGIIERNSSNWEAGANTFKQYLKDNGYGQDIVDDEFVNNNQGQYSGQIANLQAKGAQVVLIWENALAAEQIIQQSDQQQYHPYWVGFPFNLTLQTLAQAGVSTANLQKYSGMVPWPAYTCKSQRGSSSAFSAYQSEIDQFEAAYAKYDSQANLCGVGGDLLFGTWEAWRQVYDLLYQCGRNCTRDKIAGLMLSGYHATVGANCPVDFSTGDHHHGGYDEDIYHVVVINNTPVFANTPPLCRRDIT